ncbi:hypothetical protein CNMCM5793_004035 [Aspergillus hiratsukae]|uniref:Uncharacterized protein n=1 Tax=Aspergillus hiratsukae TaxID=1194566 RepID=A0A8H6PET1_9EURO|nr:hypothetical protein CNMCM5793_004035 [Aspergillus hiratsukae]KAF7161536.1 hypothetical protein CNMCM6106_008729 [Aspergillus hiratsukae]
MFNLNPFKTKEEQSQQPTSTWDPSTLTMTMAQPSTPQGPNQVVSQQPPAQEQMDMRLRGGGEGADICCGV